MKTTISNFAMLVLAMLAPMTFAACSGSDDPSVDDILSDKTTPVTFDFGKHGEYSLYDYAGGHYVGKKTINKFEKGRATLEVELRQGKHHLLWFEGIDNIVESNYNFDPVTSIIEFKKIRTSIMYAECDVNVSESLLPTQKLDWKSLTSGVIIDITDENKVSSLVKTEWRQHVDIGVIKGLPIVSTTSLHGGEYDLAKEQWEFKVRSYYSPGSSGPGYVAYPSTNISVTEITNMLCPENGLNDVQLTAEVTDKDGKPLKTTVLPKFSLKRGQTTVLRGPLFSGSTSDWQVTTSPNL